MTQSCINHTAIISISYTTYRWYRCSGWQWRTALLRCAVGTDVATTVCSGVVWSSRRGNVAAVWLNVHHCEYVHNCAFPQCACAVDCCWLFPCGRTDRQKDTTKLTAAFRNFSNAPDIAFGTFISLRNWGCRELILTSLFDVITKLCTCLCDCRLEQQDVLANSLCPQMEFRPSGPFSPLTPYY
jgi:hypothetical protein